MVIGHEWLDNNNCIFAIAIPLDKQQKVETKASASRRPCADEGFGLFDLEANSKLLPQHSSQIDA